MQCAGDKKIVSACAVAASLRRDDVSSIAIAEAPAGNAEVAAAATVAKLSLDVSQDREAQHRSREVVIKQRIESRLPARVRNLVVRSFDGLVVLEGQCATYYTKQLAQHAAMGVLEEEQLENAIVVGVE